jgi:hypothetical protein
MYSTGIHINLNVVAVQLHLSLIFLCNSMRFFVQLCEILCAIFSVICVQFMCNLRAMCDFFVHGCAIICTMFFLLLCVILCAIFSVIFVQL